MMYATLRVKDVICQALILSCLCGAATEFNLLPIAFRNVAWVVCFIFGVWSVLIAWHAKWQKSARY